MVTEGLGCSARSRRLHRGAVNTNPYPRRAALGGAGQDHVSPGRAATRRALPRLQRQSSGRRRPGLSAARPSQSRGSALCEEQPVPWFAASQPYSVSSEGSSTLGSFPSSTPDQRGCAGAPVLVSSWLLAGVKPKPAPPPRAQPLQGSAA